MIFFHMDEQNAEKSQFDNHLLVEMVFHMDDFSKIFFLCTTIGKTFRNIFYKIKFSFLCTPIDIV